MLCPTCNRRLVPVAEVVASLRTAIRAMPLPAWLRVTLENSPSKVPAGETAEQGNLRRPPYSYWRVHVLLRREALGGLCYIGEIRQLLAQSNRVGIDINQKTSIPSGRFLRARAHADLKLGKFSSPA